MALSALNWLPRRRPSFSSAARQFDRGQVADVALVVGHAAGAEPLAKALLEEGVGEILAPQGAVGDAGFGHRAVEIQHSDQTGPGAAPIGNGQDRPAVGVKAVEQMMAVLPDGFRDDERGGGIELAEDFHAHFLGVNEAVILGRIELVGADAIPALVLEGCNELGFHVGLDGPAFLVGAEAQVAIGHEIGVLGGQIFLHRQSCLNVTMSAPFDARPEVGEQFQHIRAGHRFKLFLANCCVFKQKGGKAES